MRISVLITVCLFSILNTSGQQADTVSEIKNVAILVYDKWNF